MITMRIENNIINPNFKVFEAHPFTLVHSDNTSFCYYKYIGEKYIVYQMNTGCVWPLFNPTVINLADNQLAFDFQPTDGICLPMLNESVDSSYVIDKCKTKSNDSSFAAFQVWPKIVQEKDFVYIYCFNHSITYQGITEECGNAVYKLPLNSKFYLNGIEYNHLDYIEVNNFTSHFIQSQINSKHFHNYSDIENIILRAKSKMENIDPNYKWGWIDLEAICDFISHWITIFGIIFLLIICLLISFFVHKYCKNKNEKDWPEDQSSDESSDDDEFELKTY